MPRQGVKGYWKNEPSGLKGLRLSRAPIALHRITMQFGSAVEFSTRVHESDSAPHLGPSTANEPHYGDDPVKKGC